MSKYGLIPFDLSSHSYGPNEVNLWDQIIKYEVEMRKPWDEHSHDDEETDLLEIDKGFARQSYYSVGHYRLPSGIAWRVGRQVLQVAMDRALDVAKKDFEQMLEEYVLWYVSNKYIKESLDTRQHDSVIEVSTGVIVRPIWLALQEDFLETWRHTDVTPGPLSATLHMPDKAYQVREVFMKDGNITLFLTEGTSITFSSEEAAMEKISFRATKYLLEDDHNKALDYTEKISTHPRRSPSEHNSTVSSHIKQKDEETPSKAKDEDDDILNQAKDVTLPKDTLRDQQVAKLKKAFAGTFKKGETYGKRRGRLAPLSGTSCAGTEVWFQFGDSQGIRYVDNLSIWHKLESINFIEGFNKDEEVHKVGDRLEAWEAFTTDVQREGFVSQYWWSQVERAKEQIDRDNQSRVDEEEVEHWQDVRARLMSGGSLKKMKQSKRGPKKDNHKNDDKISKETPSKRAINEKTPISQEAKKRKPVEKEDIHESKSSSKVKDDNTSSLQPDRKQRPQSQGKAAIMYDRLQNLIDQSLWATTNPEVIAKMRDLRESQRNNLHVNLIEEKIKDVLQLLSASLATQASYVLEG